MTDVNQTAAQAIADIYLTRCIKAQILANSPPIPQIPYEQTMIQLSKDQTPIVILDDDDNEVTRPHKTSHPPNYIQTLTQPAPVFQKYYSPNPPTIELDDSMEATNYPPIEPSNTQFLASALNGFTNDNRNCINRVCGDPNLPIVEESTDLHIMGESVLKEWIDISELTFEGPIETLNPEIVTSQVQSPKQNKTRKETKKETRKETKVDEVRSVSILETSLKSLVSSAADANWADLNVEEDIGDTPPELIKKDEKIPETNKKESNSNKEPDKFKCDHCPYTTNWKGNITKHVISRHKSLEEIKWYDCADCPYKAKTKEYLKIHLKQVHQKMGKRYNCTKCSFLTWAPHLLQRHNISQHITPENIDWFECEHCDFKCKVKRGLKHHVVNRHTDSADIEWFECELCPYRAKSKKLLTLHVSNRHSEWGQWFKCDKCDYKGETERGLRMHVQVYHSKEREWRGEEEGVVDIEFKCSMCGFKTDYKNEFHKHFRFDGVSYLCKF